jgi:DNA-directed RNA polymerase specialized sigma24 family protein
MGRASKRKKPANLVAATKVAVSRVETSPAPAPAKDPVELLRSRAQVLRQLTEDQAADVAAARAAGVSWERIAEALGVTRQAASKRFAGATV